MSVLNFKALKEFTTGSSGTSKKAKPSNKIRAGQLKEVKRLHKEKFLLKAEERMVTVQEDRGGKDRHVWSLLMYLTMTLTGAVVIFVAFFMHEVHFYNPLLKLLDSYDGGSFLGTIQCQFLSVVVTNVPGVFILSQAVERNRRGRMRYMIYAFAGYTSHPFFS